MRQKQTRAPVGPGPAAQELQSFLEEHKISLTEAGKAIGVSHPALIRWLKGEAKPRGHHAKLIEVWTSGRVKEGDWLTEEERRALAEASAFKPAPDDPDPSDSTPDIASTGTEDG